MQAAIRNLVGLIAPFIVSCAWAGGEVAFDAKQIQASGIATAALPAKRAGEVSGLPAQVVIPANQLVVVSTPLSAMVEQTLADVGDSVRKGQPLARLQSPALAEAQRGLVQAGVQQQLAQENLARDEALWKDGIIAESRYRATRAQLLEARATLSERRQALRLAGLPEAAISRLQAGTMPDSLLTMAAPIDGVVLEKSAAAGQRLDAAAPMFKLAKLVPLALEIQAPLAQTQGLRAGAAVSIPAHAASGRLLAIGHSLGGANQSILLRALVEQGAENLRAGQFVEVSVALDQGGEARREVPNAAIARIGGKVMVFVRSAKGFRAQEVEILHEGAQHSVIRDVFKGDEQIAVRGVSTLKSALMGIGGGE